METRKITCDQCGIEKGETNHWLIAVLPTGDVRFACIVFTPFRADHDDDPEMEMEHLCGEGCAQKRLSRWLTELKANSTSIAKETQIDVHSGSD